LIVEDTAAWQNLLKEIVVAKVGQSYELSTTRESAINLLENNDYKLIILNLNLSSRGLDGIIGYEGIDILDSLKATGKKTPVLIITSEAISISNLFQKYTNVKDCFFKGQRNEGLAKSLYESIRKHVEIQ
jgi:CheY-like chemotaxis protein